MSIDCIQSLVNLAKEFESQLRFANSPLDRHEQTDGGRMKVRIAIGHRMGELDAAVEAVAPLGEHVARCACDLRAALWDSFQSKVQDGIKPALDELELAALTMKADEFIGPLSPSEWRKRFGGMTESTWLRRTKDGSIRLEKISSKLVKVHRDDVEKFSLSTAATRH